MQIHKTGQVKGPFAAYDTSTTKAEENTDIIMQIIRNELPGMKGYFSHIGIQALPGTELILKITETGSTEHVLVGKSGLYEIAGGLQVKGLGFLLPQSERTMVEYIFEIEMENDNNKNGLVMGTQEVG